MFKPSKNNWKLFMAIVPLITIALSCKKTVDPEIDTLAVTLISTNQATLNGNLISSGDPAATEFGFCYSTDSNPSLSDLSVVLGTPPGLGEYSTSIEDLDSETNYYVRAYVQSNGDTYYGNEVSFMTEAAFLLTIGDEYQGGEIAYMAESGDDLYVEGENHGIIVATMDQSAGAEWGCMGTLITGGNFEEIGAGTENTEGIVSQCGTDGIAAEICANLTLGGYSDWVLPSISDLGAIRDNSGSIPSIDGGQYFSSTQFGEDQARTLVLTFGSFAESTSKSFLGRVRAVRYF